jgi:hypothetical protein
MNEWDSKMRELIEKAAAAGYKFTGTVTEKTVLQESGNPQRSLTVEFNFEGEEPVLLSAIEGVGLAFAAAPATAVTVSVEFFWEEFSN